MIGQGAYELLYGLSKTLHQLQGQLPESYNELLREICTALQVPITCIVTFDENGVVTGVHSSVKLVQIDWAKILPSGVFGQILRGNRAMLIRKLENDPRWEGTLAAKELFGATGSFLGLPIYSESGLHGLMILVHPTQNDAYNENIVHSMTEFVALLGNGLAQNQTKQQEGEEQEYLSSFRNAVTAMLITDMSGIVLEINPRALTLHQVAGEKVYQHSITCLYPNIQSIKRLGVHRLEIGQESQHSLNFLHPEQEKIIPMRATIKRMRIRKTDFLEWSFQDISAQSEREQLHRDLTAMAYHDMKNPLQSLMTSLQGLVRVSDTENATVNQFLSASLQSVAHLQRMVESLLDTYNFEDGKSNLDLTYIDPKELISKAVTIVRPYMEEGKQRIQIRYTQLPPRIVIDYHMITRVIINLLENASKYAPNGSEIYFDVRESEQFVEFRIIDCGPGVPKEMHQSIFERYNRIPKSGVRGVGLGLAFCRMAVEAHQGKIWVETPETGGSHFVFTLPKSDDPEILALLNKRLQNMNSA
ncbi:hypothetical protein MASR2M15_26290 [Anaerolineales bacterium]